MFLSAAQLQTPNFITREPTETQKENTKLRLKISKLEAKLYLAESQQNQISDSFLVEENQKLKAENENLRSLLKNSQSQINFVETKTENGDLNAARGGKYNELLLQNANLIQNNAALESKNAELELEIIKMKSTINDLQNKVKLQNSKIMALSADTNRLQTKNKKLKDQFSLVYKQSETFISEQSKKYDDYNKSVDTKIKSLSDICKAMNKKERIMGTIITKQSNAYEALTTSLASLYEIDKSSIPTLKQIMTDESAISYFIGKVTTCVEKERKFYQTKLNTINNEISRREAIRNRSGMIPIENLLSSYGIKQEIISV